MSMRMHVTTSSGIVIAGLAGIMVLLTAGCRATRTLTASDETFFTPLTAIPRPAVAKPPTVAVSQPRPQPFGKADSLLNSQRDQARRIGALAAQLERLGVARRRTSSETSKPVPPTTKPVVAPQPVAVSPATKALGEAERLYASKEFRRTIQSCQKSLSRGVDKGIEDRYYFLMGASYFRLRQFDLALISLRKVLEFKGSSKKAEALFFMGLTYAELGMRERGESLLEEALKEVPDDDLARSIRQGLDRLARNR